MLRGTVGRIRVLGKRRRVRWISCLVKAECVASYPGAELKRLDAHSVGPLQLDTAKSFLMVEVINGGKNGRLHLMQE